MNSIKNIYKPAVLLGFLSIGAASCEDWLSIYPQDRVVEENFWEDKNDLLGVRYGAYRQMANTVWRMAEWGDLRSDSYNLNSVEHSAQGNRDTYNDIIKGMPDSSMALFDWAGFYTTINYCNKVLQHGPEVLEKDKQFTTTEWIQMRAEMKALRALNYFYLIRAFKDVPYTTKVINTDAEVQYLGQTNQLVVLDSCIADCESVAGQARNRFSDVRDSKGMITNCAIYAFLADMYLWRASLHEGRGMATDTVFVNGDSVAHTVKGDYQLASDYADKSLLFLEKQNIEERSGFGSSNVETKDWGLSTVGVPNCNMIRNKFEGVNQGTTPRLEAQSAIFGNGNSVESIFELQFSTSDGLKNTLVPSLYGFNDGTELMVSYDAVGQCYGSWGNDACKYDSRMWCSAQNLINTGGRSNITAGYYCLKYNAPEINMIGSNTSREIKDVMLMRNDEYSNWIVYRMTDVMLIKAEALACLKTSSNNNIAKHIVNAIHRRSFCNYNTGDVPADVVTTKSVNKGDAVDNADVVRLVLNERQIELLGEGKRWFDLVRYAERNSTKDVSPDEWESTEDHFVGNGQSGVAKMVEDFLKNAYSNYYTTLKNRFKNRYGLYCPVYYMEVKASEGALKQNPVWNKSKYEQ